VEEKVLVFVEIAVGIVLGFMLFSYIQPSMSGISSVPKA
jgi:hypothetical protein